MKAKFKLFKDKADTVDLTANGEEWVTISLTQFETWVDNGSLRLTPYLNVRYAVNWHLRQEDEYPESLRRNVYVFTRKLWDEATTKYKTNLKRSNTKSKKRQVRIDRLKRLQALDIPIMAVMDRIKNRQLDDLLDALEHALGIVGNNEET